MPFMSASDGCSIHYRFDGEEGAPVVMLSNSLGSDLSMWEPQMDALTQRYRVLRYDNRGHGQSDVPAGPYTLERIATDARELIAELGLGSVLWCGVSLGGIVGMWLGANAGYYLKRAVYANTSPLIGPPDIWNQRIAAIQADGMEAFAAAGVTRWLTPDFAAAHPEIRDRLRDMIARTSPEGYINTASAIRDADLRASLAKIAMPVLVIAGSDDPATPVAMGEQIHEGVPGARFAILEAAHLSNWERTEEFNRLILNFFEAA
jgi:3-oxoadipate enol-lactonase